MKRKLGAVVVVVAALVAIAFWRCRGANSHGSGVSAATKTVAAKIVGGRRERVDPTKLQRASIAGTITDEDRAIVPRARVCANISSRDLSTELTREPRCTTADAQGRYVLGELYAGKYTVAASAKPYRPEMFHPGGDRKERDFELAAGERKTGVDIVLRKGGVEITGTVSDVTGGPVAHASVSASAGWWSDFTPPVESDDEGKFSIWVKPGRVAVAATAEGYAPGEDNGNAPGAFEILLTPESSLAGTVVDAKSGQPVAGVTVSISESDWFSWDNSDAGDITDEHGKFRVTRIPPGRYSANARARAGYGRSEGSTLVGLGQHVDGVVIKLHPAYQVTGKVVLPDKTICKKSSLTLHEARTERNVFGHSDGDGTLHADGVLPGTWHVSIECEGYTSRDKYPELVIKDKDLTDNVWEVDSGATLRGRIVTKTGAPIEFAEVSARTVGGAARAKTNWGQDKTGKDGRYELKGLKAGTYQIELEHELFAGPKDGVKIDIKAGAVVDKDFVLEDTGSLKGLVVDAQGKPVGAVHVNAEAINDRFWSSPVRTNADGTFSIDGLRAGDYRVEASHGWWSDSLRKPGSTDDDKQGEKVTIAIGKVANVKLVVESQSGVISGTVVDTNGKPVSDAYISAARESDAAGALGTAVAETRWTWDQKPVISNLDGKFALKKLSPGKYTLRAYRKGGGEAVAEHVALGANAKLQIRATGSIEGIARRSNGTPDEVTIELSDAKTGFSRHETFFRTGGKFAIRDLPQGNFMLTAEAEGGKKQLTIDLAEGQQKAGIEIALDELVTITGRVVEYGTQKPVPGMRMMAEIGKRNDGFSWSGSDDDMPNVSGEDGRFTIERAPRGAVMITGLPKDFGESQFARLRTLREVNGTGTIDIGDITTYRRRVKRGEVSGELGLKFAEQPRDLDFDKTTFKVSYIDPKGPAAKTDIKVGDVATSVDGVDITGANSGNAWVLMRAAPGTALKLGLARGTTVTIVLAAP